MVRNIIWIYLEVNSEESYKYNITRLPGVIAASFSSQNGPNSAKSRHRKLSMSTHRCAEETFVFCQWIACNKTRLPSFYHYRYYFKYSVQFTKIKLANEAKITLKQQIIAQCSGKSLYMNTLTTWKWPKNQ